MPRSASVAEHVSLEELERRYRTTRDPVERTHWQALWLVKGGRSAAETAAIVGYSLTWMRTLIRRYNARGEDGVVDHRHTNPGGTALLTAAQRLELREALAGPAPDGGLWTCQTVANWIGERIGRPVSEQRGWDYLHGSASRPSAPVHARSARIRPRRPPGKKGAGTRARRHPPRASVRHAERVGGG